ncbi:SIMPL domain-containing protein [Flavobacterium sp. DG1-102-2]|uniref:SIMPL domain-containing protein n=1 Tax=Flavobacterium sp. DG1-102-2 TaxID=3081663 RepID=UPI002948F2BE|nr:SIMPL domain-containing protein [Flavobacterium sp. DG1-102-2]MDV6168555.1 SIMPL domain-containing protein [Flavobacterium sp. DG1-102-2]
MKKIALVVFVFVTTLAGAQVTQQNQQPQISVAGEGKIKVAPDQADITIGVENTGADAAEVKKKNDATVDAVIKYLKGIKLASEDYQTQRVNLNRNYDYNKKKYNYVASQTIVIHLKDLSKYDSMMMGLVDAGVNNIQGVEFRTSKLAQYESEARVKAVAQAKQKAGDYAGALGQKVGKAIVVTDNTQTFYPQPMMRAMKFEAADSTAPQETLAIGEITVTANVNISFELN